MFTQKTLPKKELIERLKFILGTYKTDKRELDPRIVFDDDIWVSWRAGQFFSPKFKEIDENPHNSFLFRKEIIKSVEKLEKEQLSEKDLKEVFEKKLSLVLSDFKPSGSEGDIASQINAWYFKTFGTEVFDTKSGRLVPHKTSTHEIFEVANARYLYKKVINKEIKAEQIKILKLGNGKKSKPHIIFLDEIKRLDLKNKTNVYKRIKYIISDFSEKMVEEVKKEVSKQKKHLDVFEFKVIDALNLEEKDISVIECSYLFDTLSQPILAKYEGEFYEVWTRGVINDEIKIKDKKGKRISALKFKELLDNNNYKELAKLVPDSFNSIKIEKKLVKIHIEKYPYGKSLAKFFEDEDNVYFSTNRTLINTLKKYKEALVLGGFFQTFDYGFVDTEKSVKFSGRYQRYNGNITTPLTFKLVKHFEPEIKLSLNHIASNQYLSDIFNEKIIPVSNILKLIDDFSDFKEFFPLQFHKYFSYVDKLNDKLKEKYGYSREGFNIFVKQLNKIGALSWKENKWVESHPKIKDYLFDYYLALFLHFKYKLFKDLIKLHWLFEKSKNEDFTKIIEKIGFKKEVIQNLFSFYDKITSKTTFIYLEAAKKGFKKKISFSEDKIINLDNLQDYFSKMVGGTKKSKISGTSSQILGGKK